MAITGAQAQQHGGGPPDGGGGGGGRPDNPGGGGGPRDGGGGGGGGRPDNPGGGQPGNTKGDLYSDLVQILRNEQGLPLLTEQVLEDGTGTVFCLQPISAAPIDGLDAVTNPADGRATSLIPLGTGVEGEECDVQEAYLPYVLEVIFGRLNVGRSPERVLAQQLREATSLLGSSLDGLVNLDEAGRFVVYQPDAFIIDSPGNNLAFHQELQEEGELRTPAQDLITLPDSPNTGDYTSFLDHAAATLGAAAGKGDLIDLDLVVYDNRVLGIPGDTGALPVIEGGAVVDDPDFGTVQVGQDELYVDYSGYSYTRSEVFPGCVRGLLANYPTAGVFTPFEGTIMNCVFGEIFMQGDRAACRSGRDFTGVTAVHSFAQRADDTRAVIAFTHDNAVPESTAVLSPEVAGVDQVGQTLVCDQLSPAP